MKKIIQFVSFLGFVLIMGGATVSAQTSTTKVEADIPFDFVVGDRSMSAGRYVLRISPNSSGVRVLEVRDKDNEVTYLGLIATSGERTALRSELKFERIGGQAVLAGIVTSESGYQVGTRGNVSLMARNRKAKASTN